MRTKVRIGILGCATIAKRYAIKAFQSLGNAEVVSVASRDADKARAVATDFNIPVHESYDALLNNKDVDAVYIPLPIGLHKEWILKAALAGKHVISEKSISDNLSSVKEIVDACRTNGIVLYEDFMCDFHPQHKEVQKIIEEGTVGELRVFESFFGFPMKEKSNIKYSKQLGGGSLNDVGAYTVFMARKIFGKEPASVVASLYRDSSDGVDMRGNAVLDFGEGKLGLVTFDFDAVYQNNYSIWGSKGLIRVEPAYSIPPDKKPGVILVTNDGSKETKTTIDMESADQFELIFRDFCNTILEKENKKDTIEGIYDKILSQAKILEAVRISAKENRRVQIDKLE